MTELDGKKRRVKAEARAKTLGHAKSVAFVLRTGKGIWLKAACRVSTGLVLGRRKPSQGPKSSSLT